MARSIELGFAVAIGVVLVVLAGATVVASPATTNAAPPGEAQLPRDVEPPAVTADTRSITVDGERFDAVDPALAAADPGDRVVLEGRFEGPLTVDVAGVTVVAGDGGAVVDGGGQGDVLRVTAENVTVADLWIRNSGYETDGEDAGVFVDGNGTVLQDLYLSEITFGVWVDGVDGVSIRDSRIEGRPEVTPLIQRGNGIQLWETEDTTVAGNEITTVRDGIYYSWAEHVVSTNNTIWDSRYGVHYMYSDDNRLADNLAVDNDVGYALMISERLTVSNNTAIRNAGQSGHGILLKGIERSTIEDNVLVENGNGLYVYNSVADEIEGNLVLRNRVGLHHTAGSERLAVVNNSVIDNDRPVVTTTSRVAVWNDSDRGNYWSSARTVDVTNDGVSDVRHRPAGLVEHLTTETPQAAVFTESPAFDTVRLAESSFPVVQSPGVVDHHPLTIPPHGNWSTYAHNR